MINVIILAAASAIFCCPFDMPCQVNPGDGTWLGQQQLREQQWRQRQWRIENLEYEITTNPTILDRPAPRAAQQLQADLLTQYRYHARTIYHICDDVTDLRAMVHWNVPERNQLALSTLARATEQFYESVEHLRQQRKILVWIAGQKFMHTFEAQLKAEEKIDIEELLGRKLPE
jgi:hypothetical protein